MNQTFIAMFVIGIYYFQSRALFRKKTPKKLKFYWILVSSTILHNDLSPFKLIWRKNNVFMNFRGGEMLNLISVLVSNPSFV